jgi:hypothetical protein
MSKNNIIILDWDDTLFPTTWVNMREIKLDKNNIEIFKDLDNLLILLFKNLVNFGEVVIITNAMNIWIDTCLKVLNKTKKIIKKYNIKIISAREEYRKKTNDPTIWKIRSFKKHIKKTYKNIISIGDSLSEYRALIELYNSDKTTSNKYYKTIKFINNCRNCDKLIIKEQVRTINNNIKNIVYEKRNLDLVFKLKKK